MSGEKKAVHPNDLGINPNGLYTIEQAAKFLMRVSPKLTYEEALAIIRRDIASGKLPSMLVG